MRSYSKKWFRWFLLAVVGLGLVIWLLLRTLTPSFTPPPLPSPNGYDGLVRAAEMLHPRTGFYDEMEEEELQALVAHNDPALDIAREALELDCGVPIDWTWDPAANGINQIVLSQASTMRNLARAFMADSRSKSLTGQTKEAIDSGLDEYRLGVECNRGGIITGHLVGIAIREMAIDDLRRGVAQAPEQREEVLKELSPLLESTETADEVVQREIDYIHSASRGPLGWLTVRATQPLMEPVIKSVRQAEKREKATGRLFLLHLAIGLYHEKYGSWPTSLDQLSPESLPEIPLDPYSNAPFIYKPDNDGYALYSVGENGKDDGGEGDETGQKPDVVYEIKVTDE